MDSELSRKLQFLDNNARFKALFLLLLRSEDYLQSDSLATELHVTARTIKNDLKLLQQELENLQIQLISKRSKGYKLDIPDFKTEQYLKEYFQIYQATTIDNEFDIRVQYIIRRLISSPIPIKMELLQEELYVSSHNSLTKELQGVKEIIAKYQLSLQTRFYYGIKLEGCSYKKIMLGVRMYKYFDKNTNLKFGIPSYEKLFLCTDRKEIRKIVVKAIMNSRIVFSDLHMERFIIYLIYLKNKHLEKKELEFEFPELDFNYTLTDEYALVSEVIEKLRNQIEGFQFNQKEIEFLTYIAIMSTDLYRFADCSAENYDSVFTLAETIRNFVLQQMSDYLQINMFDDYTCLKDSLKIMIPISMKIKLGVSDDIDLGYSNRNSFSYKPILLECMNQLEKEFYNKYSYSFSRREKYLIFNLFLGLLNRVVLPHSKLKLALIAIDGRLGTQQLKFNLKHYFSEFIDKTETRVLYELESLEEHDYDYYLCMDYGKNMNITYSPIYFANERMTESEYLESLTMVFFDAYGYDKVLPPIQLTELKEDTLHEFITEKHEDISLYRSCTLSNRKSKILVYYQFNSEQEDFHIIYHIPETGSSEGTYAIIIRLNMNENAHKLKMIVSIIDKIAEDNSRLQEFCENRHNSYKYFFIHTI